MATMAASMKMDELLVQWLTSDNMYDDVLNLIEENKLAAQKLQQQQQQQQDQQQQQQVLHGGEKQASNDNEDAIINTSSPRCVIPKFYSVDPSRPRRRRRLLPMPQSDTWMPLPDGEQQEPADPTTATTTSSTSRGFAADNSFHRHNVLGLSSDDAALADATPSSKPTVCVRDQVRAVFDEIGQLMPQQGNGDHAKDSNNNDNNNRFIPVSEFVRITKDIFRFPSFFSVPVCQRILLLWRAKEKNSIMTSSSSSTTTASFSVEEEPSPEEPITYEMVAWYWLQEMEPYDPHERFFRLCKQPHAHFIVRDDFLPFIKALLSDHPVRKHCAFSLRPFWLALFV
jgi:EF-hand domain